MISWQRWVLKLKNKLMEKISLYQLTDAYQKLSDYIEDDTELDQYLGSLTEQIENKVDNIVKFRQELIVTSEAIDSEIKRLTDLKKKRERLAERLKENISRSMLEHNKEKLDTGLFKLSFLKSETTDIFDESIIPSEFRIEKITFLVDKKSIKDVIKKGGEVPGAKITTHNNLQIK